MCAAHCKQSSLSFTAGAGSATLMSQRQSFGAAQQIPHPDYNSRLIDWDYMVIRIDGEWDFSTEYVQPIKVNFQNALRLISVRFLIPTLSEGTHEIINMSENVNKQPCKFPKIH